MSKNSSQPVQAGETVKLFLCGDVMTGRGIDQVLPHPGRSRLYEPYVDNANDYVALAEEVNGVIPKPVDFDYIWGDAITELTRAAPDIRIINLETSITANDHPWPAKAIHYHMNPANISCLTVAKIDCCTLANNHVLDWGYDGLKETLQTLRTADILGAGAGEDKKAAAAPAILDIAGKGRVLVFAYGMESSGVPREWAASDRHCGVNFLPDLSSKSVSNIRQQINAVKRSGDVVVVSLHWGSNWGYAIPDKHIMFAHRLIDDAGVDVIHGHSSHHPRGLEIYHDKPVLYGCGDFINDYEGIRGYEQFRDDLAFMYFISISTRDNTLAGLELVPMQMKRFRSQRASAEDVRWLLETMNRASHMFGTRFKLNENGRILLQTNATTG